MMKDSSFNLIWRVQEKVERSQDKPDLAEHVGTVGICPHTLLVEEGGLISERFSISPKFAKPFHIPHTDRF